MAGDAIAVVRRAWKIRLDQGLDAALREVWAEDCVFEDPPGFPEPRVHTGRGGVRGAFERMNVFWEEFTIEPIEFVQVGERVLAICWIRGRPRGNAAVFKVEVAYVYDVEADRIVRCRCFTTSEEATEVAEAP